MSETAPLEVRARWWGGRFLPYTNRDLGIEEGEYVTLEIRRERSGASHRHQFAWVTEAWHSLPEDLAHMPWAETPDTLRKHALIATGYHHTFSIDCSTEASARRVQVEMMRALRQAHGYAIGQVRGPILTLWTPESQSLRAMGRERFQASKQAILEWIADKVGVKPEDLGKAA